MGKGIIQSVFVEHYPDYSRSRIMSRREAWAAHNIMTCRTEAQGVHRVQCDAGDFAEDRFNSCRHRSCPKCGWSDTEKWIRNRQREALRCSYVHVIFTIPDLLHPLWAFNRQSFANIFFAAAWGSLKTLLTDNKWLGALPGAIAVFQTWGETLNTHPHIHFLVTAGGIDSTGAWCATRQNFFLPARVLRDLFRGKLLASLRKALDNGQTLQLPPDCRPQQLRNLFNRLGRAKWHVQIEPPYPYSDGLIKYVAHYIHRGPISEHRIRHQSDGTLRIAYKHPDRHSEMFFTLSPQEFIARFLNHVPPSGMRAARTFGLFHHHCRVAYLAARRQLGQGLPLAADDSSVAPTNASEVSFPNAGRCPKCGQPLRVTFVTHAARGPPCSDRLTA